MSAADSGKPGPDDSFLGFRTYADDTPRTFDARAPAYPAHDDLGVGGPEPYDGDFGDDGPAERESRGRRRAWPTAVGFAVLAVAAGLAVTRWGPERGPPPAPPPVVTVPPTGAASPASPAASTLPNAASPPRPSQVQVAAATAPRPVAATAPSVSRPRDADPIGDTLAKVLRDLPAPSAETAQAAPPPPAAAPSAPAASDRASLASADAASPGVQPSFDCRYPHSYAQRMICEDPGLAAQDRRMTQAYARALAAGVPEAQLRAEQGDWLNIREDAAHRSPAAVRSIYQQRIEELETLAANGPR